MSVNVAITGATGYIGNYVVNKLVSTFKNINILTINRDINKAKKMFNYKNCEHVTLEDKDKICKFNPEILIHLATFSTSRNDEEIIDDLINSNINYGVKLLSILSNCTNFKLFVNVGSFAEYRLGNDKIKDAYLYTATKSAFRHFVDYYSDLNNFKYINPILYTVYGGNDPNKKLINYIYESMGANEAVNMTKGEQILDFIHVEDVANFFYTIIENRENIYQNIDNGQVLHIGTGVGIKIKNLADIIANTFNQKCNINWGGVAYRPLDTMKAIAPYQQTKDLTGWRSKISIADGLKKTSF